MVAGEGEAKGREGVGLAVEETAGGGKRQRKAVGFQFSILLGNSTDLKTFFSPLTNN
jgi:hypothetical protein